MLAGMLLAVSCLGVASSGPSVDMEDFCLKAEQAQIEHSIKATRNLLAQFELLKYTMLLAYKQLRTLPAPEQNRLSRKEPL